MKKFILGFFGLAAIIALGLAIKGKTGHVIIAYYPWTIEMPLWLAVIGALLVTLILLGIWKLLRNIWLLPRNAVEWFKQKRLAQVRRRTVRGFIALTEGRWKEAEQLLSKNIDSRHTALLNCLGAAIAAQGLERFDARDEYLRLAHQYHSHADIAIGLTQARLQLMQGQMEQALATLKHLQQLDPDHAFILNSLKDVLLQLKEWEALQDLLIILKKKNFISAQEQFELSKKAYTATLVKIAQTGDMQALDTYWQRVPAGMRYEADLLVEYVPSLIQRKQDNAAEALLKEGIKHHWDDRLVNLYGKVQISDTERQLKTAQAWLKKHPDDPVLYLTLGRLFVQQKLWGEAKHYFEMSLTFLPQSETFLALGDLLAQLRDPNALQYYQKGLRKICAPTAL